MIFDQQKFNFMRAALLEAEKAFEKNEVPIGAIITFENKIIARGHNQIESLKDATAHAEMIALTSAANHLQSWRLTECEIYVTVEPCLMCAGAILLSRLKSIYFGVFDSKFGACGSVYNVVQEKKYNHVIKVQSGILADKSELLLKSFFHNKRDRIINNRNSNRNI